MKTIEKIKVMLDEEQKTVFVEQDKAKPVVNPTIDQAALVRMLNSSPPDLETVMVRCDRVRGEWQIVSRRTGEHVRWLERGILKEVTFTVKIEPGYGCGSSSTIGFATGKLLPIATPISVPSGQVKGIGFDRDRQCFFRRDSFREVEKADYRILKDGCSAEMVVPPERVGKKKH